MIACQISAIPTHENTLASLKKQSFKSWSNLESRSKVHLIQGALLTPPPPQSFMASDPNVNHPNLGLLYMRSKPIPSTVFHCTKDKIRHYPRKENWVGPKWQTNLLPWGRVKAPSLLDPDQYLVWIGCHVLKASTSHVKRPIFNATKVVGTANNVLEFGPGHLEVTIRWMCSSTISTSHLILT